MVVLATDLGKPPLTSEVLVQLSIVDRANHPPVWDEQLYAPITIPENISVGQTIYSIKARFVVLRVMMKAVARADHPGEARRI